MDLIELLACGTPDTSFIILGHVVSSNTPGRRYNVRNNFVLAKYVHSIMQHSKQNKVPTLQQLPVRNLARIVIDAQNMLFGLFLTSRARPSRGAGNEVTG